LYLATPPVRDRAGEDFSTRTLTAPAVRYNALLIRRRSRGQACVGPSSASSGNASCATKLRDRRTIFMIAVLPILLYPVGGLGLLHWPAAS